MMTPKIAALMVRREYQRVIESKFHRRPLVSIPSGGKLEHQSSKLIEICVKRKRSLGDMMSDIFKLYEKDFCLRTFKRPYPPITVVLSDKAFERAGVFAQRVEVKEPATTKEVEMLIKSMDREHALTLLNGGWLPHLSKTTRENLIKCLKPNPSQKLKKK